MNNATVKGPHQGQKVVTAGKPLAEASAAMILVHGRGASAESILELAAYLPHPEMAYLGNRPRRVGVMEKCHFCIQRTRAGRYPACLEVCPTGARKFGNFLDPESEVHKILTTKRVFVRLKEEIGTAPRFYYYFDV